MSSVVVVGTQWGDEGKGKITDFLSENAEAIARYQGGNNAGHTIKFDGVTYKLHLIPSGIFYKEKISVIGNGMVVDPKALVEELKYLHDKVWILLICVFLTVRTLFYHITFVLMKLTKNVRAQTKSVQRKKVSAQLTWIKQRV